MRWLLTAGGVLTPVAALLAVYQVARSVWLEWVVVYGRDEARRERARALLERNLLVRLVRALRSR